MCKTVEYISQISREFLVYLCLFWMILPLFHSPVILSFLLLTILNELTKCKNIILVSTATANTEIVKYLDNIGNSINGHWIIIFRQNYKFHYLECFHPWIENLEECFKNLHISYYSCRNNWLSFDQFFTKRIYFPSILLLTTELLIWTQPNSKSHSIYYMKFTSQMANKNFEYVKRKRQKGMDLKKKQNLLQANVTALLR